MITFLGLLAAGICLLVFLGVILMLIGFKMDEIATRRYLEKLNDRRNK